jgi:hypothetical protein
MDIWAFDIRCSWSSGECGIPVRRKRREVTEQIYIIDIELVKFDCHKQCDAACFLITRSEHLR